MVEWRDVAGELADALRTYVDRFGGTYPMGTWLRPGHDVIAAEHTKAEDALLSFSLASREPQAPTEETT